MYRKCFPSGRNVAQRCVVSAREASSWVAGVGAPPAAETRESAVVVSGAKRMTPSRFQPPLLPLGAAQRSSGGDPLMSTFFNFPSAKNARKRLSGDQNGKVALSVPGMGF